MNEQRAGGRGGHHTEQRILAGEQRHGEWAALAPAEGLVRDGPANRWAREEAVFCSFALNVAFRPRPGGSRGRPPWPACAGTSSSGGVPVPVPPHEGVPRAEQSAAHGAVHLLLPVHAPR